MEPFRNLEVWKKAHKLVLFVYRLTAKFPTDEKFGLVSQMRRAIVSVASNIVEGAKRKTKSDRRHFILMSDTSLEELKYHFILGYDLGYIKADEGKEGMEMAREIGMMLNAYAKNIRGI